jgi:hypothetical protein
MYYQQVTPATLVSPGDLLTHVPSHTPYVVALVSPTSINLIALNSGGRWSHPVTFYGRRPTGGTPFANFPGIKPEDWHHVPREDRHALRECDIT